MITQKKQDVKETAYRKRDEKPPLALTINF